MAATIATAIGRDERPGMTTEKEATRLGASQAEGKAQTFKTFAKCIVNANGSGEVTVERIIGGKRRTIGRMHFGPEDSYSLISFYARGEATACRTDGIGATDTVPFDAATNGGQF